MGRLPSGGTGTGLFWPALALATLLTGSHSFLLALTKVPVRGEDGREALHIPFDSRVVVALQELAKLGVCLFVVAAQTAAAPGSGGARRGTAIDAAEWLRMGAPAALYALNNNLAVRIQAHCDPATFQVLCSFKILTTALLYRGLLSRPLALRQWLALGLLFLACAINASAASAPRTSAPAARAQLHIDSIGLGLMALYCSASGLASVLTEALLKRAPRRSLFSQGVPMYSWGVLFSGAPVIAELLVAGGVDHRAGVLRGVGPLVWVIVATQATNGFLYAAVMKHSSNITRLFIIGFAMVVSVLLSRGFLGLLVTWTFSLSAALMLASVAVYYHRGSTRHLPLHLPIKTI